MKIKRTKRKLIVSFQPEDAYYEIGYTMIEQLDVPYKLPYVKEKIDGIFNMVFSMERKICLRETISRLTQEELVDLLYVSLFLTYKVEENGFMNKTSIMCNPDYIFFQENKMLPMFIFLPVFENSEKKTKEWEVQFLTYIQLLLDGISYENPTVFMNQIEKYLKGEKGIEEILEEVNQMGSGNSQQLVPRIEKKKHMELQLYHREQDANIQFQIQQEEYVIGKRKEVVDGVISNSDAVSKIHCKIIKQNELFFVQDLDSVNHTFVNGEVIPAFELMELQEGDVLSIADVVFRVHLEELVLEL